MARQHKFRARVGDDGTLTVLSMPEPFPIKTAFEGACAAPRPDAFPITKSDVWEFAPARIYCGASGDVAVTTAGGAKVTFHNFPAGSVLPVKCTQVLSKGTTADYGFVGIGD